MKYELKRQTKETTISISLNNESKDSKIRIVSPCGFFNHMLEQLCFYSGLSGEILASGDEWMGTHHFIEDVAITLGRAIRQQLGESPEIERFANGILPMDETLVEGAIDISGRPYSVIKFDFPAAGHIGGSPLPMPLEMVPHFFNTLAMEMRCTLHLGVRYGTNLHHQIEALFKLTGKLLESALKPKKGIQSTKGILG